MYAYPIIHAVLEKYRGLPAKLAGMTDKSVDWWRSHGYQPKTDNPLKNGNISPADHYLRYVRLFEAAMPGAGRLLNAKISQELAQEFADTPDLAQENMTVNILDETCDVNKWLAQFQIEGATKSQLRNFDAECDEAIQTIADAKAKARVQLRILEMPASAETREYAQQAVNGRAKR